MSLNNVASNLFPVSTNNYWFITSYIVFSFFIRFINKLINNLSKKTFFRFLVVLTFFVTVLPLVSFNKFPAYNNGGTLSQFLTYYCFVLI